MVLESTDMAEIVERVERIIGRTDKTDLIEQLVDDSANQVLLYTNRTVVPYALFKCVGDLAVVAFNRLGTEGDIKRTEGGESYEFEAMPKSIYTVLNNYRLARVCGNAYEGE